MARDEYGILSVGWSRQQGWVAVHWHACLYLLVDITRRTLYVSPKLGPSLHARQPLLTVVCYAALRVLVPGFEVPEAVAKAVQAFVDGRQDARRVKLARQAAEKRGHQQHASSLPLPPPSPSASPSPEEYAAPDLARWGPDYILGP